MKNLFIDSSRKSLSLALTDNDKLLFISNIDSYNKHSNFLMNEINNILIKAHISVYGIDNIIVLNGPGSFTGIRIGVTVAKTLAWVLSKKIYALNNLKALALSSNEDVIISIIFDKDKNSYVGIYEKDKEVEGYLNIDDDAFNIKNKNISIVAFSSSTFLSNLNDILSKNNNVKISVIEDYDYIKIINYALNNKSLNPHLVEPVYLKKIDAEK